MEQVNIAPLFFFLLKKKTDWTSCTLCRTGRLGLDVLQRASQRKVEWPQQPHHTQSPIEVRGMGGFPGSGKTITAFSTLV